MDDVEVRVIQPGTSPYAANAICVRGRAEHDWVMLGLNRRIDHSTASTWYCRRCRRVEEITAPSAIVGSIGG